jgi:hypothetical protein
LSSFATLPTSQLGFAKAGSQQQQPMSSAAQPISAGMSRTVAFDNKQPPMTVVQGPPMTTTAVAATPMMASSAGLTAADRDKIRQVAEFCANKGVAKLKSLKENPEAKTIMPFLFEGNPGHEEFMSILKSLVGLAANQAAAAAAAPVTTTPLSPMGQGMTGPPSQSRFSQAPYQQQQPSQQGGSYYGPQGGSGGGGGGGQNYQNRDSSSSSSSNYYSNPSNNNPQQRRGSRFG